MGNPEMLYIFQPCLMTRGVKHMFHFRPSNLWISTAIVSKWPYFSICFWSKSNIPKPWFGLIWMFPVFPVFPAPRSARNPISFRRPMFPASHRHGFPVIRGSSETASSPASVKPVTCATSKQGVKLGRWQREMPVYPLVMIHIAMENVPVIVDRPMKSGGFPWVW